MRSLLIIVATLAFGFAPPAALADSLCAALAYAFPQCDERSTISPGTLPQYRLNKAAFAGELCMWSQRGRVCSHEMACSPAEYARGRCL
jgi:hypothetical protein